MITLADIAAEAFDAVSQEIDGVIHDADLNGVSAGRVIEDDKAAPSSFPSSTLKDKALTIYCEGFQPEHGDTIAYAGKETVVFWSHDILAANGLAKASVLGSDVFSATGVTFQRESRVSNGAGGFTTGWADISGAATTAHVEAVSGDEAMGADRIEAQSAWRIVCPFFAGLKESDSVVIDGRRHNIRFVNDWNKAGAWLVIDADLGVAV